MIKIILRKKDETTELKIVVLLLFNGLTYLVNKGDKNDVLWYLKQV